MSDADRGHFGPFGGRFVAETLIPALDELDAAWRAAKADPAFTAELDALYADYVGRPSRLTYADQLSRTVGGEKRVRIYLKREDLNHTGAHKINNCVGQALLARRMGKKRLIAETGACPTPPWLASAAARTRWGCSMRSSAIAACSCTASKRRGRASPRGGTRRRCPRGASAFCTARSRSCSPTTMARSCRRIRSRRG